MGNICSVSISCDAIFSRCLDCTVRRAAHIRELQANLDALRTERQRLIEARNDLVRRVTDAELQRMKRTDQVKGWLSRVEAAEAEADNLIRDGPQEIEKLCLGGYCSKNCKSSYKFGKQVVRKLKAVSDLIGQGVFEVVAERDLESVGDERSAEPHVVGLQSTLEKVWRCLVEEPAGIVGLFGMGGVGKTTLLTQINNKFLKERKDFGFVIWVVVSKDQRLEKIQEFIGKKIGMFDDSWMYQSVEEKALDIYRVLKDKKFVLLLDDIWERVDLTKVGVPLPSPQNTPNSKVVFTTRSVNVCGSMEAHKTFKVECLSVEQAWELCRKKVGEGTLDSHPDILELARLVADECCGLPLALITIGRAMAYKTRPKEWRYALDVLKRSASESAGFAGLGKEVYPLLKFSYDSLPNDAFRSCFSYCCLYPEDYKIPKRDLIDCWICEGFLDESGRDRGYHVLRTLVEACLLEEVEIDDDDDDDDDDGYVKMHDVIRDMALWITSEIEQEKEGFMVYAGAGLTEAPDVRRWKNVRRLSLMQNQIENLSEVPSCPRLLTLFLDKNEKLEMITNDFFQSMTSLKVLKMSYGPVQLPWEIPLGISNLVSLQLLDVSYTGIQELPMELRALENLKCLNLNVTWKLSTIPRLLICSFSKLRMFRMFGGGVVRNPSEDSVLFGGGEVLVEELLSLKHLEVLDLRLTSFDALQRLLSSPKLRSCTQSLQLNYLKGSRSLDVSLLADLKELNTLHIRDCSVMEDLKIDCTRELQQTWHNLHNVYVDSCNKLKDLTFLVFASNLKHIFVQSCRAMEEIISVRKLAEIPEMRGNKSPFSKLQYLILYRLDNLKSIYPKPLPFPDLKEMRFIRCNELRKLPLDSNSAKEIDIYGTEDWMRSLQWEDEATQNAFLPRFRDPHQ